ncbi:MAG: hypothetical protein JEZ06_13630 [Anaerolineaceae bacterium]|nr:hypothetical protein [Anaerolineaceae bacterium]
MSKIYSFRLNENNPREAQAREVIEPWRKEGHSIRYMLPLVLLKAQANGRIDTEMDYFLEKIREIVNGNNHKL